MTRFSLIKQIHTLAYRDLRLDEETYRMVVRCSNDREKDSCSDLAERELELVLAALRRLLRRSPYGQAVATGRRTSTRPAKPVPNKSQHGMIAHLMEYLGWSWPQTAKLCKRLTGWDNTRKCSAAELRKVILAMVAVIEQNHASGKRTLSHTDLFEFRRHTQRMKPEATHDPVPLTEHCIPQ